MVKTVIEKAGLPSASTYQAAIFEAMEQSIDKIRSGDTPDSLIIEAKPGSGKTTTGVAATRLIPEGIPTVFVAFNKKIAEELSARLPSNIPARTFHAHWLRQWGRYVQNQHGCRVEVDHFKVKNAVEKYFGISRFDRKIKKKATSEEVLRKKQKREQAENVVFLVEKAKMFGVVPRGYSGAESVTGYEDNDFFWLHVLEYFNYQIDEDKLEETIEITREILWEQLDNETVVDFADMMYLPAVKRTPSEAYQIVMIDEAQDLNGLQRYLLGRMVSRGGMIIAIGDTRQSVYAFRGADVESMAKIKEDFSCSEYPLSISYRCARKIVELAYEIYPEIEAAPDAPDGSVERPETIKIDEFKPGHLVICRNNAPIIDLAYRLIRHRIPAKVLGREIGEGLMKLIRKLDLDNTILELVERLRSWRDHQIALIERREPDDERSKEQIRDKYECISNLAAAPEITTVEELLTTIDSLFTKSGDEKQAVSDSRVTLSTIHKIKGAEAATVFILDPHLINPPWIKTSWQSVQEENLRFVAITRAKTRLVFIASVSIRS